ncbi:MAG: tetratricopeptide repeat protein, partial [Phycisphaerales bacterium]|nr:tetratricopeptide repeat protein [Phycisphaerales bacterium]
MPDDLNLSPLRDAFARGDLHTANQQAALILRQDPRNLEALRALGQIRLFQGLWAEAQAFAAQALQVSPDDHAALLLQARIFSAQGRSDDAIEVCDRILAAEPDSIDTRIARASVLERVGRIEEAMAVIEPLAGERGGNANLLARCLLRTGDTRRAVEIATEAAARPEVSTRERYHLLLLRAKGLDKLGEYDNAMAAAREAKTLIMPQGFDPAHFTGQVDALIGAYSRAAISRF